MQRILGYRKSHHFLVGLSLAMVLSVLSAPTAVQAVPNLQIYIPGAQYDFATETWVINSFNYELWVIGANYAIDDVKIALAAPKDQDGSINLTWLNPGVADYGSKDVSSLVLTDTGSDPNRKDYYNDYYLPYTLTDTDPDPRTYGYSAYGTPLMGDGDPVPGHGVFPTTFFEYFIGDFGLADFDDYTNPVYNYIPDENGLPQLEDTARGDVKKFYVSVQGDFAWVDIVAYDHVVLSKNKAKYVFSPFSHDGEGTPVPEPATIALLASGLVGLTWTKRQRKR